MSLRYVCQALFDFRSEAREIFRLSPDRHTEVAEDTTRDALDRMPGFGLGTRIFGTMDYKRAGYVILPEYHTRQALLVDSKAEKIDNVARVQLSQTSLPIRQIRAGQPVNEQGQLGTEMHLHGERYLVSTYFVHYHYEDLPAGGRLLKGITLAALPSGLLAAQYVPTVHDTIFIAGPNAPKLGEVFRTRVSFRLLKAKARWRVQRIRLLKKDGTPVPGDPLTWDD